MCEPLTPYMIFMSNLTVFCHSECTVPKRYFSEIQTKLSSSYGRKSIINQHPHRPGNFLHNCWVEILQFSTPVRVFRYSTLLANYTITKIT
jgi:hypothetical protein